MDRSRPTGKRGVGLTAAVVAAVVSGCAVFYNSFGVRLYSDATLYTTLKNTVVGVLVIVPMVLLPGARGELSRLRPLQWAWLAVLALIGGSLPYALFFEGLRETTPATGAVLNHLQFAVVALLAVPLLRERVTSVMWLALAGLVAGAMLGTNLGAFRWNRGAALVLISTLLFGGGFVLAKHLLRNVSTPTVMAAKMTGGSAVLLGYCAATGRLQGVTHLNGQQWAFVMVSGLILLGFTAATLVAIKHIEVTTAIAIGMGAPAVTLLLQEAAGRSVRLLSADVLGLAVTLLAVTIVGVTSARLKLAEPSPRRAAAA